MRKIALLVLFFLLLATPAQATILFAGGEDSDFDGIGGTTQVTTTAGRFNSTFARCAIFSPDPSVDGSYVRSPSIGSLVAFWAHMEVYPVSAGGSGFTANKDLVRFYDSSNVLRLVAQVTTSNVSATTIALKKVSDTPTYTTLATSLDTISTNTLLKFDFYVNYAASGQFTMYVNGVQFVTYSGDVTTNGQTALNKIGLGNSGNNAIRPAQFSQVVIATTDTRNMQLATLIPSGAGNATAWTGAYTDIDEVTLSDADLISSATALQREQWTIPALPAGTYSVPAVVQTGRITRTATGPQQIQWNTRSGGTDYDSASVALTEAFAPYFHVWSTNPATAAAWTTGELGTAGLNFGVEANN